MPGSCGYPDATSTGPSTDNLKRVPQDATSGPGWHYDPRGWVSIDGTGAVFSGYQVSTNIDVTADDVTIANNLLALTGTDWGISMRHADGITIDHNTIHGQSRTEPCDNAIRDINGDSDDVTITANNLYHCSSGINHFNQGGTIADNYIHDLGYPCNGSACPHFNGIQLGSGDGPAMTIDHNTILNPNDQTDAIMLANDDGPQTNRTITNNLLAGGGYTFYGSGGPDGRATNITATGNKFSTRYYPNGGYWGPVAHWQRAAGNTWSNNTWADGPHTGQTINPS